MGATLCQSCAICLCVGGAVSLAITVVSPSLFVLYSSPILCHFNCCCNAWTQSLFLWVLVVLWLVPLVGTLVALPCPLELFSTISGGNCTWTNVWVWIRLTLVLAWALVLLWGRFSGCLKPMLVLVLGLNSDCTWLDSSINAEPWLHNLFCSSSKHTCWAAKCPFPALCDDTEGAVFLLLQSLMSFS